VGAQLGANLCTEAVQNDISRLLHHDDIVLLRHFTKRDSVSMDIVQWFMGYIRESVLGQIQTLVKRMGGDFSRTIQDYFLFTLVGAVITRHTTWIFSLGDGVAFVNGENVYNGSFAGNAPPYLAYGLVKTTLHDADPSLLQFRIHDVRPTESVQSLLIGTDGVMDFMRGAERIVPGKNEPVGPLSQFWEEDRYFKNPDMMRRRLSLVGREGTHIDWERRVVEKIPGLLADDTTMVVVRRKNRSHCEE